MNNHLNSEQGSFFSKESASETTHERLVYERTSEDQQGIIEDPNTKIRTASGLGPHKDKMNNQDIKSQVDSLKSLIKPLTDITNTKISPDYSKKLQELVKKVDKNTLPDLHNLLDQLSHVIEIVRQAEQSESKREFIRFHNNLKEQGIRAEVESETYYRTGIFGLEIHQTQSNLCRFDYNRQHMTRTWESFSNAKDLEKLYAANTKKLTESEIPLEIRGEVFENAYEMCRRDLTRTLSVEEVPLKDFYKELRLALARKDMDRNPDANITHPQMPEWAFLYNLDKYSQQINDIPQGQRLQLQTGSQATLRQSSFVVGGLVSNGMYQKVAFIHRSPN